MVLTIQKMFNKKIKFVTRWMSCNFLSKRRKKKLNGSILVDLLSERSLMDHSSSLGAVCFQKVGCPGCSVVMLCLPCDFGTVFSGPFFNAIKPQ